MEDHVISGHVVTRTVVFMQTKKVVWVLNLQNR